MRVLSPSSRGELPNHNDRGFTLVEMIVVISIVGILAGIAAPSLLSLNKPLREATSQFQSQLSLIRTKAISSNRAYRIRPRFGSFPEYNNGIASRFVVEYAANCTVAENSPATPGVNPNWQGASQFDLDLPTQIGINNNTITIATPDEAAVVIDPGLDWNICFDNRGIVGGTPRNIAIRDFQDNNKAKIAAFITSTVGGTDVYTYDKNFNRFEGKEF